MANEEPILLCDPSRIGFAADPAITPNPCADAAGGPRSAGPCNAANGAFVRSIIRARAIRREFFGTQLFADPAWDMLLELYALTCEGRRVSVSKLSLASGVPGTTALRWIEKLERDGLAVRFDDPHDARRVWISLSRSGYEAMQKFVERIAGEGQGL